MAKGGSNRLARAVPDGQTVATNFVKNFEIRYIVCYNVHRADFSEEMNGDS